MDIIVKIALIKIISLLLGYILNIGVIIIFQVIQLTTNPKNVLNIASISEFLFVCILELSVKAHGSPSGFLTPI